MELFLFDLVEDFVDVASLRAVSIKELAAEDAERAAWVRVDAQQWDAATLNHTRSSQVGAITSDRDDQRASPGILRPQRPLLRDMNSVGSLHEHLFKGRTHLEMSVGCIDPIFEKNIANIGMLY